MWNRDILVYFGEQLKKDRRQDLLKNILVLILEREGERNMDVREKHWLVVFGCNPGVCPDWESNQQPFGSLEGAQQTKAYRLGPKDKIFIGEGLVTELIG